MTGSRARRTAAIAVLAALGAGGLAACSGASFSPDDLAPGACREVGDPLLDVDSRLRALADEDIEPAEAAEAFPGVQERLAAAGESADPAVAGAMRDLRTALGFYRAGVDTGSIGETQQAQVRGALDALLRACGAQPEG